MKGSLALHASLPDPGSVKPFGPRPKIEKVKATCPPTHPYPGINQDAEVKKEPTAPSQKKTAVSKANSLLNNTTT